MSSSHLLQDSIQKHFGNLVDHRVQGRCDHRFLDIITIAVLAVLAGAEGWQGIETYGQAKQAWLKTFLELPNDIPSHDTFRRVFTHIEPQAMESSFRDWVGTLMQHLDSEVIAIDGKTVKGSYDRNQNLKALQLVSAWADEHRLVLGQTAVDSKSNEITAIPLLRFTTGFNRSHCERGCYGNSDSNCPQNSSRWSRLHFGIKRKSRSLISDGS